MNIDVNTSEISMWPPRLLSKWLLGVGVLVYVISFFLPAVSDHGTSVEGWLCAWVVLVGMFHGVSYFVVGLINPLALIYVVLRLVRRGAKLRRWVAIVALASIPASWIVIVQEHFGIRIGHYAWIAGLALILGLEAIRGDYMEEKKSGGQS
jgi:hypothetical protein